jgi:hypothetical protein
MPGVGAWDVLIVHLAERKMEKEVSRQIETSSNPWPRDAAIFRVCERMGNHSACDQNRRGVGGVWGRWGSRRNVGPVGVAEPLRCSSSSDAVADTRPCARGVAKGEFERY